MDRYYFENFTYYRDFITSCISADILLTHEMTYLYDKTMVL